MSRQQSQSRGGALRAVEREAQAVALRRAGVDYRTIASQLGYANPGNAYRAVSRALLRTLRESGVEELRALELARLDAMLMGVWQSARSGHLGAIDAVLKIQQRRARLLGL